MLLAIKYWVSARVKSILLLCCTPSKDPVPETLTRSPILTMLKLASFVALAMSISLAQAGKRGLAWPWCTSCSTLIQQVADQRTVNGSLDPGVLNNGDGEVVAMYVMSTIRHVLRC